MPLCRCQSAFLLSSLTAYLREQDKTPLFGLQQSPGGGSRHEHGNGRDIPAVVQEVTYHDQLTLMSTFCSDGLSGKSLLLCFCSFLFN
jgi:hypothetical protein